MRHRVIIQAITAEILAVRIKHYAVGTGWNQEAIVGERAGWREVKHEEQIATHKGENLIAIIMPDFYNWCLVKILFACNRLEHFSVEISKIVVAEFMIIYQIPLSAGVFMAPAITLAREINPLWVTELITHEVEITAIIVEAVTRRIILCRAIPR